MQAWVSDRVWVGGEGLGARQGVGGWVDGVRDEKEKTALQHNPSIRMSVENGECIYKERSTGINT